MKKLAVHASGGGWFPNLHPQGRRQLIYLPLSNVERTCSLHLYRPDSFLHPACKSLRWEPNEGLEQKS